MAVEVAVGTPLADALQTALQPKLVDAGWSTDGLDDSALSEYIILMLVNGKTQEQIASELSNDLLGLSAEDNSAIEFSRWLFEQVDILNRQLNSGQTSKPRTAQDKSQSGGPNGQAITGDTPMGEAGDGSSNTIPTGPKAMRNGLSNPQNKRMLGQINKAMEHNSDATIRRINTGRVNSHYQEPPRGSRNQMARNLNHAINNNRLQQQYSQHMIPLQQPGTQMSGVPVNPSMPMIGMTPQQQMQLFAIYEEQARMMAEILSPQQAQQIFPHMTNNGSILNPGFQNGSMNSSPQQGKSLFDRVEPKLPCQNQTHGKQFNQNLHTSPQQPLKPPVVQSVTGPTPTSVPPAPALSAPSDSNTHSVDTLHPSCTTCRFNLTCTNPSCAYAHQSPAAPPGIAIDMADTCPFGAACKNRKCVASHPSPAKKVSNQSEQDCRFWPHCTNPLCSFKHPDMPLCRNGADCNINGCKFAHPKHETPGATTTSVGAANIAAARLQIVMCKYDPCLNPSCSFKHREGQKRGSFQDRVWTADGSKKNGAEFSVGEMNAGQRMGGMKRGHVSERKFVGEGVEEELILPGSGAMLEHDDLTGNI